MQKVYQLEQEQSEKEENDQAAEEAAKDLDVDYGTSEADKTSEGDELEAEKSAQKHGSVVNLLRGKSIHSLAATGSGLDSLIGAGSVLEMSDGDTDFLKSYSERVAMEADESDSSQKQEDEQRQAQLEAKKKQKEENGLDSVNHAKAVAAML